MIVNWRTAILLLLFFGPIAAYLGLGALWLLQHGWLLYASIAWIATGAVFAVLARRWTDNERRILPPLDWESPETFSPFDRQAWEIVQAEASRGESVALETLTTIDLYLDSGRRMSQSLARHYHPLSTDPIERVPVVDILTALELAADDLNQLCRQVPGGDLITPGHWKEAVRVAGFIQKANDWYTYLMPIFQPVTGLMRLGTQQLMVKPAWKNMQQNILRWFYQAYVNRLGTHLIELYSGRLSIGTTTYRKIVRKGARFAPVTPSESEDTLPSTLTIAVAGAKGSGKSALIQALGQLGTGDQTLLKARLLGVGVNAEAAEALLKANWVEVPAYPRSTGGPEESSRDRSARREAVAAAVGADLLVLLIDAAVEDSSPDLTFAREWDRWYVEHPGLDVPPAVTVLTGVDRIDLGPADSWKPPYHWAQGPGARENAVRGRIGALRGSLPPAFIEMAAVGLHPTTPFGLTEGILPALATLVPKAERISLLRHFHNLSQRSRAGRLLRQVGKQGRSLWDTFRRRPPGRESA